MKSLSDQIRKAIDQSGITRYRIAQESGIAESVLSRFMAGTAITTDTLDRLAAILGIQLKLPPKGGRQRQQSKGK